MPARATRSFLSRRPARRAFLCSFALALATVLALSGAAAFAEEGEDDGAAASEDASPELAWDQGRMTELTAQLARQMREVRNAFRNSPNWRSPQNTNRKAADQMSDTLKRLDKSCASLAKRVSKGEDAEETRGLAQQIGSLLNDADQASRRLMTDQWTQQRVRPAMETINAIAPYYGRGPLYDVETMTRQDRGPNPSKRSDGD